MQALKGLWREVNGFSIDIHPLRGIEMRNFVVHRYPIMSKYQRTIMKERLIYVDQIKGIAILLVIMGHLIQFNGLGTDNAVFEFIYSFHMPLFFIISGYIGFKTVNIHSVKSYGSFLKKKFISLVIPLLFWSLIVSKFFFAESWYVISIDDLTDTLLHPGLWFLQYLFIILAFYGLFHWISFTCNKRQGFIPDLILLLIFILLFCAGIFFINKNLFTLLLYPSFFFFGVFVSKYKNIESLIMKTPVFECCLLLFMVLVCHWTFAGDMLDDLYKVIISISFFIVIMNVCLRIRWNQFVSNQIVIFGQYSLCLYIEQFYITKLFLHNIVINEMNPFILFVMSAFMAIGIAYLCIGFAKIIEKTPVLNFLMFGKRLYNARTKIVR
jgi:fucose 4-O-acetylase-like acetyltransferase